jgi:hypothetical protein
MRAPLPLRATTHDDRTAVLWRISEAMSASGAVLLDSRLFSNAAAALFFEVRAGDAAALRRALEGAGLTFDDTSVAALAGLAARAAEDEIAAALHVTFVHGEPDLAIDVPKVPG